MTTKMLAPIIAFIFVVFIKGNCEAAPAAYYDVPSGKLIPISGVVPVSVPRFPHDITNRILRELRIKFDKNNLDELDSSIRNDILMDGLTPAECFDNYGLRDGILKRIVRGTRDVIGAVISDVKGLGQGVVKKLPVVPHVINGIAQAITLAVCGVEDAASDAVSGLDEGPNILTKVLVELIEFEKSAPLDVLPAFVNITKLVKNTGVKIVEDIARGVKEGAEDLADEVTSGVEDVVGDVKVVVGGVGKKVGNVFNAVKNAVGMIGGGVHTGVGNIAGGVKGGLRGVIDQLHP